MSEVTKFEIGAKVRCSDGACGKLLSVVVDPVARVVTHIVVEPEHRWGLGRLIPLKDVAGTDGAANVVQLRCTLAEFDRYESAEETEFLSEDGSEWGYAGNILTLPYYGLSTTGLDDFGGNAPQPIVYDKLPVGEVAVRRGQPVEATDGRIGKVQGLVIDPADGHVTHVLLQEGHLWGRREVTLPISAVESVGGDGGVRLTLSKDDVDRLPPVDVDARS
ncbi:MAG TPA: PRC-barrel domain-containing protein [Frankiaceae bacterium]|nr:PRC-barrel domain-containing protein [Frankiaceae bacterium]